MSERGFTLVELMISMVLGLVIIGGAMGVILANRQSYRANEGLSQIQESARTAFELLARDVRQAGVTGCDSSGRVANVLQSPSGELWWQDWFGIRGFEGAQDDGAVEFGAGAPPNNRIEGTDSIQLQGIEGTGLTVVKHEATSANFKINVQSTAIAKDDIVMVCDFDHAAIFKITNYNSANVTVGHGAENSGDPRNCSKGLGYPVDCASKDANGNVYSYGPNSQLSRLKAVDWYIGDNQRPAEGGRSLFRRSLSGAAEEIVAGVTDMQISYREAGETEFGPATAVGVWTNVNAVMITLTLHSADPRLSTDASENNGRFERTFTNVITLRNRVP
ncbi:PilW family protein [Peristeroidobacter agariperforans]|uniref:PilW family protein n=1 Tax=Peristeroidobacter agariperforans TaxID=268404 RepID=UPI00101C7AD2|nr:prepilin-type N-terminal cleavage/methylation domain-containing protein [Peristeroidobacter agariperforans]